MQMVMSMLGTGRKTKLMDMEFTVILMELVMKGIGKKIDRMVKVLKLGLMEQNMLENMLWEKSMDKAHLIGQMGAHTQVSLLITTLKAKEFINGQTYEDLMEIGKIIKWMVEGFSHGLMVVDMMENTLMTKSLDMGSSYGLTEEDTKEIGKKENRTEKEHTSVLKVKFEKDCGKMERG